MLTSKSPRDVAMVALAAGKEAFSDYSHIYSPKKFTQPQLFACLVLKEFEKKDYRGIRQLLVDCPELQEVIGLTSVPHYTTLQKASRRLLRQDRVRVLLDDTVRRIRRRKSRVQHAAVDSSGFDARHASRYFIWRRDNQKEQGKRPKKRVSYRQYGKLMLIVCCDTHAILAAVASTGRRRTSINWTAFSTNCRARRPFCVWWPTRDSIRVTTISCCVKSTASARRFHQSMAGLQRIRRRCRGTNIAG